ncbi:MAG TPA: zinc-binding dehydrogenase [Candidatus Elarobacter sp.]|nr:zinc-binding dehydrogenase [Candidatus Elarobacter sp.]
MEVRSYGDPSVLEWRERDEPVPGRGEVAIRVTQTGVNFADVQARRGAYHGGQTPPFVPGLDCTGTIVALGEGVEGLRVGQRVAAFPPNGSYAEVVVVPATTTYALDQRISDDDAASLLMLVTGYNILTFAGRLAQGESVLVHAAAGGVGSTAVQIARALGAGTIFATVGSEAKRAVARDAGADVVIDYQSEDFARAVLDATNGRGVDLILDSVAGEVFNAGLTALAPFGRIVAFGMASGTPGTVKTNELHPSNRAVIGYSSGSYRKLRPEALRPAAEASLRLVAEGKVHVVVGARFPLREAADAHRLVESRAGHGKVLLTV